jgi:methyl-accepting chemotaxis protein
MSANDYTSYPGEETRKEYNRLLEKFNARISGDGAAGKRKEAALADARALINHAELLEQKKEQFNDFAEKLDKEMDIVEEGSEGQEGADAYVKRLLKELEDLTASTFAQFASLVAIGLAAGALLAFFLTRSLVTVLKAAIEKTNESSCQMAVASRQISRSSQELSGGATEQAASLEETSAALEQIAAQTRQNADNAASSTAAVKQVAGMVKHSSENARVANNLACESRTVVEDGARTMNGIAEAMKGIRSGSEKITDIIEVINEITHQTKMLATNAAIEAARAGDQGKGFAVVADEVSKLAENSKHSAKEIAKLIKESSKQAEEGSQMAEKGRQVMSTILDKSVKVADLVSEISAAAEEQAHKVGEVDEMVESINKASSEQANGIDQITKAVTQMDQVTQQNAANAEESAAASEELSAQAEGLKEVVAELRAIIGTDKKDGKKLKKVFPEGEKRDLSSEDFDREERKPVKPLSKKISLDAFHETLEKSRGPRRIKSGQPDRMLIKSTDEIPMRDDFKEF